MDTNHETVPVEAAEAVVEAVEEAVADVSIAVKEDTFPVIVRSLEDLVEYFVFMLLL